VETINSVWVIVGLAVLAFLFLIAVLARMYRKAGPHEALIVYGLRGTRIVKGGGTVIIPMVEVCRELSLELMSFDVAPQQDLYTVQGVAVTVEAVAQIKVKSDPESIRTSAEQFLTKPPNEREGLIRLVMEGHLRGIIGQLTVEQIVKEPEMVADRMRSTCAEDLNKMGLDVVSFTIKEVRDKNEYISNMGRPDVARIKRDADVAAAEADRDTAIKRAEATRASAIARAQADQERVLAETASLARQAEATRDMDIKKAQYLEASKKAGRRRQGVRNRDQRDATASCGRVREGAASGARGAGESAGCGNRAPRERADRHGAEAGGNRAAEDRNACQCREAEADV
jgi:flotillin